jgi:hypothetical protein
MSTRNEEYARQMRARLKAKVAARNKVNELANAIEPTLLAFFARWVGKKILKSDHSLTKTVAEHYAGIQLPPQSPDKLWQIRFSNSDLHISVEIGGLATVEEQTEAAFARINIGQIRDTILTELAKPTPRRTDFTVEAVEAARLKAEAASDALRLAQNAEEIGWFGMYER